MSDAAATGAAVLAALEKGRRLHSEQDAARVRELARVIAQLAKDDADAGRKPWGLAGRIEAKLHGLATRRTVAKYLARLSERSNFLPHDRADTTNGSGR